MGNKKESESLCWKCKRVLCAPGCQCPWSRDYQPVEGWDAEPTLIKNASNVESPILNSFRVKSCPLFIKQYEFETSGEVVQHLLKTLKISRTQYSRNPEKYILRYEKETKKIIPKWYKIQLEEKREKRENKLKLIENN